MSNCFFECLSESEEFKTLTEYSKKDKSAVNVVGVVESQKAHMIAALLACAKKRACIVSQSESAARKLCEDLKVFCDNTVYLPGGEFIKAGIESLSYDTEAVRVKALRTILDGANAVVSVQGLLNFVSTPQNFKDKSFTLRVNDEISNLPAILTELGYKHVAAIESKGQFSNRGGITDVFPPDSDYPYRIELFGDEVESIRFFSISSQLSLEKAEECRITPALANSGGACLTEYFKDNSIFVFDEPAKVSASVLSYKDFVEKRAEELILSEKIDSSITDFINDYEKILKELKKSFIAGFSGMSHSSPDYTPDITLTVQGQNLPSYGGKPAVLADDIKYWKQKDYRIFILAGTRARAEGIKKALNDFECQSRIAKNYDMPDRGETVIFEDSLDKGFLYSHIKTVFVSGSDIFVQKSKKKSRIKVDGAKEIRSFDELKPGNYVVHSVHGIGLFSELVKITTEGVERDYLKVLYRNNDNLYVPVSQLNLIYKYSHANIDEKPPKLNRLASGEWQRTKTAAKTSVKQLAIKLVDLYAERSKAEGHAFCEDTTWQAEFESEFEYEETPDQLTCIEEMKKDMESKKPMDRLLCGDVGYGKTEVAIRGAFKCVMDGMQCAYLVPTTILAAQHYNHFCERMKDFPVKIEMLSRFRTETQQKKILEQLKSGEIDVIIGTHKLLSDKVKFKALGLLVIDEEQRFGVAHKEKIKNLKKGIDVLTLTATPIPRTLNMAMTGIRDMSVITSPPENRHPIQTYVMEYDEYVIKNAIEREMERSGQVYYVYNRIAGIYGVAEKIKNLVPNANVAVAHGRMNEAELESIMLDTMNGEVDVLVCTTIIETGIDIQNVNTIIIENADRMGLAQLYQIRGRIGRSDRIAYAYLTYNKDKSLSEDAEKRLVAIKEFTELGSGFKIALRDLEIRGAGNVFGPEQHGFMASVGYDMYVKLLEDAVKELSGKEEKKEDAVIDVNIEAVIPTTYIEDASLRLEAYRMIAGIENNKEAKAVVNALYDRYGKLPKETQTLIDVSLLRIYATEAGISEVSQKGNVFVLYFSEHNPLSMERISRIIGNSKQKILFGAGARPYISLHEKTDENGKIPLENLKNLLKDLQH